MEKDKPLVNNEYLLEKFTGKGGWTFARIPEVLQSKENPFGWVKVSGSIDGFPLKHYKLMPMGDGQLFLPVKATIRKKINKSEGDFVKVILYEEKNPIAIPEEILLCFENEPPEIYENFLSFTEGERKAYLDWIYEAKKEETKAERILKMMDRLQHNKKFFD